MNGYVPGKIDAAYAGYRQALATDNYAATKDKQRELDAELDFSAANITGSVKLLQTCRNITSVTITVNPA